MFDQLAIGILQGLVILTSVVVVIGILWRIHYFAKNRSSGHKKNFYHKASKTYN